MQRKEGNVGNTFATAANLRASHDPSTTPTIKFSKYVIGSQAQQVTMPDNLNHLVSPSFATKTAVSRPESKLAPEKAKSRNESRAVLGETKSLKASHFESSFKRDAATLEAEAAEPTISASVTTRAQVRENAHFQQRQGKQSVGKPAKTVNFSDRRQSAGGPKQQL